MVANFLSIALVFIQVWFRTGARRSKRATLHGWSDSNNSHWFIALAKEQLALITDDRFHRSSLVDVRDAESLATDSRPQLRVVELMADGEGIAPTRACAPLGFRDRGIAALPTIRKMVRVERIALPTSSFQVRPSATDITP